MKPELYRYKITQLHTEFPKLSEMLLKGFFLSIAVISVLVEKSISTTQSQMTEKEKKKEAALMSSFVQVHKGDLFVCIGYIYYEDFKRVFAALPHVPEIKLSQEPSYYDDILVKSTSRSSKVESIGATNNFMVIFLKTKLENNASIGFTPERIVHDDENPEIDRCFMIKWNKEEYVKNMPAKFDIYYPKDNLYCKTSAKAVEAVVGSKYKIKDGDSEMKYSVILLRHKAVLAFSFDAINEDNNYLKFLCKLYKAEKSRMIIMQMEPNKSSSTTKEKRSIKERIMSSTVVRRYLPSRSQL